MFKLGHQVVVEYLSSKCDGPIPSTTNKSKQINDTLSSSVIAMSIYLVALKQGMPGELSKTMIGDPHPYL